MGLPDRQELRVGDQERQAVVDQLRTHLGAGRLELDEFEDRTARALAARTVADLVPLTADLPATQGRATTKGPPIRQREQQPAEGWDLAWRIHRGVTGLLVGLLVLLWLVTGLDAWPMVLAGILGVGLGVHGVVKRAVEG